MINRINYEIWFIDYYDGTLSPQQVADLFLFLETNPDLKQAFESFENIQLDTEQVDFSAKAELKRPQITTANFNDYAVAYLEGDLSPDDVTLYLNALQNNAYFNRDHLLFAKTKLHAEEKRIFPSKELLKRSSSPRIISLPFVRYAVAACVLFAVGYYFVGRDNTSEPKSVALIENEPEKKNNIHDHVVKSDGKTNETVVEENKSTPAISAPLNNAAGNNINTNTSQVADATPTVQTAKATHIKNVLPDPHENRLAESQKPVIDLLMPVALNSIALIPASAEPVPLSLIDDSYVMVMQNMNGDHKPRPPLLEVPGKVKEEAIERMNSYALQTDAEEQQLPVDEEKLKWLAVVGKVVNKITFKKVNIETTYSPQGDLMAYQVTAGKLNFERQLSK